MIHVEASRVIARPMQEVWAYLSNLDNMPSIDPGLLKVAWHPPMRPQTRIEMYDASPVIRFASRIVPPVFTVTDFEDGRRFGLGLVRGPSSMRTVYSLEAPTPELTKVTRSFTMDGRGIWRLLELAIKRRVIRDREAEVENLKRMLEAEATAG